MNPNSYHPIAVSTKEEIPEKIVKRFSSAVILNDASGQKCIYLIKQDYDKYIKMIQTILEAG